MNAFTMLGDMLGNLELTPGQLTQLRALNRKYAQRVYTLLHESEAGTPRELTKAEAADLDAKLMADILALLTPEQQSALQNLSS
jgi:Spy/CpxP family protein refolding chaperone